MIPNPKQQQVGKNQSTLGNSKLKQMSGKDKIVMDGRRYKPITKGHIMISKHETLRALMPFTMVGSNEVWSIPLPDNKYAFTGFTDGYNVVYCKEFLDTLTQKQANFLIGHENLHKLLKHMFMSKKLFKIDPQLTGISADYQVNFWLHQLDPNRECIEFIDGALFDEMYEGWSHLKIFKHLQQQKKETEEQGGTWSPDGELSDEMDFEGESFGGESGDKTGNSESSEDINGKAEAFSKMMKDLDDMIAHSKHMIAQGSQKANKLVEGQMAIKVRWESLFEEIVMVTQDSADDRTYEIYNRRNVLNDEAIYPTDFSENVGELVMAFDCSASIVEETKVFVKQVQEILERMRPEKVRVLFWDTQVISDQVFTPKDYPEFSKLIKTFTGGGTNADCIEPYLKDNNINWEAICIFTDGYLNPIDWQPRKPVLWVVVTPNGETNFKPTQGKSVPYIPDDQNFDG